MVTFESFNSPPLISIFPINFKHCMCWLIAIIDIEAKNKMSNKFIFVFLQYQSQKPYTITELELTLSCSRTFTVHQTYAMLSCAHSTNATASFQLSAYICSVHITGSCHPGEKSRSPQNCLTSRISKIINVNSRSTFMQVNQ